MTEPKAIHDEGYLLQKTGIHLDDVKRIIDVSTLDITKEYIQEQAKLRHSKLDEKLNFVDARVRPSVSAEFATVTKGDTYEADRFYVTDLCMPYNPAPDDRDIFAWFNNIAGLSGRAGYVRIRDGYVYGVTIIAVS